MSDTELISKDPNIIEIEASRFKEILHGNKIEYIFSSHRRIHEEQLVREDAKKKNIEPNLRPILIPANTWRLSALRQQFVNSLPKEGWQPDPEKPLVHIIKGSMYFSRASLFGQENYQDIERTIDLLNCIFENGVTFQEIISKRSLILSECTFKEEFKLSKSKFDSCSFINNSVFSNFEILDLETCELAINKGTFKTIKLIVDNKTPQKLIISNLQAESIEIVGKIAPSEIVLKNLDCQKLDIKIPITELKIFYDNIDLQGIKRFNLEIIENNSKIKISINTANTFIDTFTISGILNEGRFTIKDTNFKNLNIKGFTNNIVFQIHNVTVLNSLNIHDSSLGKAEFNNVKLECKEAIQIYQSNISDINLLNSPIPNNIIAKNNNDYEGLKEIFCQLKNIANRQKNKVDELKYQQLEFDAYEKLLRKEGNWQDKFILYTNKWSNNHGQEWFRAFSKLLFLSIFFYCVIKILLGYLYFNPNLIWQELALFLNFAFNPLHDFKDIFPKEMENAYYGSALLVDTIAKLLSGYLIFQGLRAFRKYAQENNS